MVSGCSVVAFDSDSRHCFVWTSVLWAFASPNRLAVLGQQDRTYAQYFAWSFESLVPQNDDLGCARNPREPLHSLRGSRCSRNSHATAIGGQARDAVDSGISTSRATRPAIAVPRTPSGATLRDGAFRAADIVGTGRSCFHCVLQHTRPGPSPHPPGRPPSRPRRL
jgi:hypothetical protein